MNWSRLMSEDIVTLEKLLLYGGTEIMCQKKTDFDICADQPKHDMSIILSTYLSYSSLLKLHHPNFQVSKWSLQILYR